MRSGRLWERTERSEGRGDMFACVIKMEEMVMERERSVNETNDYDCHQTENAST